MSQKLTINPKFQSLIPPPTPEELSQLESNLVADGCRDALVVWKGALLDGHNRFEICERRGLKYSTASMDLPDENAAMVWIIQNQFGRRNLTPFVRVELALKLEPLLKEKAKSNQRAGGQSSKVGRQKSAEPQDTRNGLAKVAGVSHDTIAKGKIIAARASEETKAALRRGETSINAEHRKLTVHVGHNSGENEWYTPSEFVESAREAMGGIDCDPASSEIANKTVKAKKFFTVKENGLERDWNGRVFLNPPYAQPAVADFANAVARKFDLGEIEQACVLVNNATETAWFQMILELCSAVCFPKTRIKFLDQSGNAVGAPLQGQAMIYLGKRRTAFRDAFKDFGPILYRE